MVNCLTLRERNGTVSFLCSYTNLLKVDKE